MMIKFPQTSIGTYYEMSDEQKVAWCKDYFIAMNERGVPHGYQLHPQFIERVAFLAARSAELLRESWLLVSQYRPPSIPEAVYEELFYMRTLPYTDENQTALMENEERVNALHNASDIVWAVISLTSARAKYPAVARIIDKAIWNIQRDLDHFHCKTCDRCEHATFEKFTEFYDLYFQVAEHTTEADLKFVRDDKELLMTLVNSLVSEFAEYEIDLELARMFDSINERVGFLHCGKNPCPSCDYGVERWLLMRRGAAKQNARNN